MRAQVVTVQEALQWASSFLNKANREEKVAEILLLHELNLSKAQLLTRLRETINPEVWHTFQQNIKEHAQTGKPVQHFTGLEVFYDRLYHVNEHVLIPRPETEELVDYIVKHWHGSKQHQRIVDVGTGSGIIAITLAKEREDIEVIATDISEQALQVAQKNADRHQADVTWQVGNFLQPLIEREQTVDLIVSNPPYIDRKEMKHLADTVKDFDPGLALFAENHGLSAYETIIQQSKHVLAPNGDIVFEIGDEQAEAVTKLIKKAYPNHTVECHQDMNGRDRMLIARRSK
ncbi:peptide chain release factor N(5)-glutamine methyltransferase, partial [Gracilibacillus halophilus]